MDFATFIVITGLVSYAIYTFMDKSEHDIIQERLMKFAQKPESLTPEEKNAKVKDTILQLIQPFISKIIERKKDVKSLRQLLLEAGKASNEEEVFKFIAKKVVFTGIGIFLGGLYWFINPTDFQNNILFGIICPMIGFRLPDMKLKREIKIRFDEITYNLPDALDLLTVCVEAGLGLDAALTRVAQEQQRTSPILASELGRVSKEIMAGIPRQDAFRNLATRNNVPDLKTFTALLIQTDKLGTSISQSLRTYSDTVRTRRRQRVEALASQASVKMIIPMVMFILPAMFVVLLGPAAINLVKNFQGMGK